MVCGIIIPHRPTKVAFFADETRPALSPKAPSTELETDAGMYPIGKSEPL